MNSLPQLSVLAVLAASIGLISGQERFCPREARDGLECRGSKDPAQFKCAIFYNNLLGNDELKWVGALPEAISTVKRKDPSLLNSVFPKVGGKTVEEDYFESWAKPCDQDEANDKCYILMTQVRDNALDSCDKTIGNLEGADTVGNQLCAQAVRFLNSANIAHNGVKDQVLSFQHSSCGNPWTPVESASAGKLYLSEKLCCTADGKFYRCDGSAFNDKC